MELILNAIELFLSTGKSAKVWACGKCKLVKKDEEDAKLCCEPWTCKNCGLHCDQYRTLCESCDQHRRGLIKARRMEAAVEVTDYDGWVFCEEIDGHNNGYWPSLGEFQDYMFDDFEHSSPEFVYCCTPETKEICITDVVQTMLCDIDDEMADNFFDSLEGMAELEAAVEKWNLTNKTRLTLYEADYKRKVRVNYRKE